MVFLKGTSTVGFDIKSFDQTENRDAIVQSHPRGSVFQAAAICRALKTTKDQHRDQDSGPRKVTAKLADPSVESGRYRRADSKWTQKATEAYGLSRRFIVPSQPINAA